MGALARLEKWTKPFWITVGFALIGAVGVLDLLTGYELAFSLFYLLPISLVAWFAGLRLGLLSSLISAFVWLVADVTAGSSYSGAFIYAWNTLVRLLIFVIAASLLSALKGALERERALARTDYLTGAANSRFFYDLVQMEIDRLERYGRPFTMAYIDIDDFKAINDQYGHSVGDQVLRRLVESSEKLIRKTDVLARLGGDEFALLLPETGQEAARITIEKMKGALTTEMQRCKWPVTFSIGVLTCTVAPGTADELVKMTDEAMYSVKRNGKNAIGYSTFAG